MRYSLSRRWYCFLALTLLLASPIAVIGRAQEATKTEPPAAAAPAPAADAAAPADSATTATPTAGATAPAAEPVLPPYFAPTISPEAPKWPDAGGGNSGYWITPSPGPVGDGDPEALSKTQQYDRSAHNMFSINVLWVCIAACLVMFMQAGFMFVETGLCRAKNAAHTSAMNLLIYPLGCIAFYSYGWALGWGNWWNAPVPTGWYSPVGPGTVILNSGFTIPDGAGHTLSLCGLKGFFLNGMDDVGVMALFFYMMVFMDTTATIPTGAMAERWSWKSFCLYGLWVALPYCIFAHWVWGGGWLAQAGVNWGLGHGAVDFAGSGVVHTMGGIIALAGAIVLGPRIGKYVDGKPVAIPGHNIPMVVLGTFILAFGWFGFNGGSTLSGTDLRFSTIMVNTMLASVTGCLAAMAYMMATGMKPDPSMMCNGMLAGLVAITAPCAFVDSWAAALIGAVAGVLVVLSVFFWDRVGVDDPVGAISVHGVNGVWGILSVGIFANGKYGLGFNGVERAAYDTDPTVLQDGVRGILFGDPTQLVIQAIDAGTLLIFGFVMAFVWFKLSNLITPIRVPKETEMEGLDLPEMGALGYPDFAVKGESH